MLRAIWSRINKLAQNREVFLLATSGGSNSCSQDLRKACTSAKLTFRKWCTSGAIRFPRSPSGWSLLPERLRCTCIKKLGRGARSSLADRQTPPL